MKPQTLCNVILSLCRLNNLILPIIEFCPSLIPFFDAFVQMSQGFLGTAHSAGSVVEKQDFPLSRRAGH